MRGYRIQVDFIVVKKKLSTVLYQWFFLFFIFFSSSKKKNTFETMVRRIPHVQQLPVHKYRNHFNRLLNTVFFFIFSHSLFIVCCCFYVVSEIKKHTHTKIKPDTVFFLSGTSLPAGIPAGYLRGNVTTVHFPCPHTTHKVQKKGGEEQTIKINY